MLFELNRVTLATATGQPILSDISFQLEAGTFVALLGASGAGKSSLLKLMNRLQAATSGSLYFQDRAIEKIAVKELRRQVMLVGQSTSLLNMNVWETLNYPLKLQEIPSQERQSRVTYCLDQLQIPQDWLDKTELALSGGQKQQVAIARGLVTQPKLLLLDEPTSALDLGAATRVLTLISQLVKERGLSVVMSNHQLDLAENFCDRVLYLEQGCLRQDLPANEVDWLAMRQTFVDADAQSRDDWGDEDEPEFSR
ncbi:MAG: ATP-binding cassette domain-containing protein [Leptolyngbyaceae cyanobacterium]